MKIHEDDFIINDFAFAGGETIRELRLHYRTLGSPRRDARGKVSNTVLILHGTTGSGAQFLRDSFAGELFGPGQLLDANHYFIILPDGIGHGGSSKPSDGARMRFPRYGYHDMARAQHALHTEGLGVDHVFPGDGHIDGWYAYLVVGANVSRLHGLSGAFGVVAGRDRGAQPHRYVR